MKKFLLFLILLMFIVIQTVSAIPELPPMPNTLHQFYGNVNCNGNALTGRTLKAVLDNVEFTTPITNSQYGYNPSFFVSKQESSPSTTIYFYIDNYNVATYAYQADNYTKLDLTANSASCPIINNQANNQTNNNLNITIAENNKEDDDKKSSGSRKSDSERTQFVYADNDANKQVNSENVKEESIIFRIFKENNELKAVTILLALVVALIIILVWIFKRI